jgi:hypothetical protein
MSDGAATAVAAHIPASATTPTSNVVAARFIEDEAVGREARART